MKVQGGIHGIVFDFDGIAAAPLVSSFHDGTITNGHHRSPLGSSIVHSEMGPSDFEDGMKATP